MDGAARRKLGTSSGQDMCLDNTLAESFCTGDRRLEVGVSLGLGSHCSSQSPKATCNVKDPVPKERGPGVYRVREHGAGLELWESWFLTLFLKKARPQGLGCSAYKKMSYSPS